MSTIELELPSAGVRWLATIEGSEVETVRELVEPPKSIVAREDFDSPMLAREYVDEQVESLLAAGFVRVDARPTAAPAKSSVVAMLAEIDRMQPVRADNPEMLAEIETHPDDPAGYLVYADWLQEQGDPFGLLIALHHGQEANPMAALGARRLMERFPELLVPGRPSEALAWQWGFAESLQPDDLAGIVGHRAIKVLRELACDAAQLEALPPEVVFPHVHTLHLVDVSEDLPPVAWSRFPALRRLVLSTMDNQDGLVATLREAPAVALLGLGMEWISDPDALVAALEALPDPKPALWIGLQDSSYVEHFVAMLGAEWDIVPDLPASPLLDRVDRAEVDEEEDEDDEEGEFLEGGVCPTCKGEVADGESLCPHCGRPIYHDDDLGDGDKVKREVCAHDAARDPNHDAAGSDGVDRRWEAPKDDVFDIDDA